MKFHKTKIDGVYVIDLDKRPDERGYLVRTFDKIAISLFSADFRIVQSYISETEKKGTVRGLHYQTAPYMEAKLTKCITGEIYEVVADIRKESKTYLQCQGFRFRGIDAKMLLMPKGIAHGFLTLADNTAFLNFSNMEYNGKYEKGIRFDDPGFNFRWPVKPVYFSEKDKLWPDFKG